ncbi:beta-ketoacyl synthase N-terminal-like domain-containing protein [Micromonospora sp. NPDC000207]|uniref:beta-ketoacyl synthase N-terminal-like domain-containing protein n=1 Tax=Micromonospora sp. NPDC000207 TaxID=3154246 RepID=UPI003323A6AD
MTQQSKNPHAVVLSAAGPTPLRHCAERLRRHVEDSVPRPDLAEVAYTTQVGRTPLAYRLAVFCRDHRDLADGLAAFLRGDPTDAVRHGIAGRDPGGPTPDTELDAATAWVSGRDVDWRRYWPTPPRRVPLPTYPFGVTAPATPAVGSAPEPGVVGELERYLVRVYTEVSGNPAGVVAPHRPLTDIGLSSYLVTEVNTRLEQDLGVRTRTLFFEHGTLAEVAAALAAAGHHAPTRTPGQHAPHDGPAPTPAAAAPPPPGPAPAAAASPPAAAPAPAAAGGSAVGRAVSAGHRQQTTEIAVIGVAGRYPRSPGLAEFWDNLVHGRDCVTPLPQDRARPGWPVELMEGGYLDQVDRFDPMLFGITPRDAALMDPQERLFLEVTWEALESAGYPRTRLRRRHHGSVAVYAGAMWNEYPYFGVEQTGQGFPQDTGATLGGIANRVSYHFDLHGPSLTVDTMCSSALVALDLAVRCLRQGDAEVAITGAVSLSLHPNKFRQQQRMTLTATDRRSRSFGAGGDGFVPAEGVGVLVLKPLDRALADGDPVHGVVRGTAVVHAGRTNGYLVPNPAAQAEVVRRALRAADTAPTEIGYVEAHGAGTALGDPVEIDGLTRAYGDLPVAGIPIGSVKSTIGHTEAAAGLAGLTKVLLQLRHGVLAPSLHADDLNPDVPWDAVPFRVQRDRAEWRGPRVAGISSFGAGGTIAHAVVAAPPTRDPAPPPPPGPHLVVLSAADEDRLAALVDRVAGHLRSGRTPSTEDLWAAVRRIAAGAGGAGAAEEAAALLAGGGPALADVAYTLQVGREPLRQRLAVVVEDVGSLVDRLDRYRSDPTVMMGRAPAAPDPTRPVLPVTGTESWAEIGRHWVDGGPVDWERLHPSRRSVVDLPSYPFAGLRCWAPEPAPAPAPAPVEPPPPSAISAPVEPPPPAPAPQVAAEPAGGEVPLYRRGWRAEEVTAGSMPDLTSVVCLGGAPGTVAALGVTGVRDEVDLTGVLADRPDVSGLLLLPGEPDWETRVAVVRRLLSARPRTPLRIVQVADADVRTAGFVRALGAEYARVTATVLDTDRADDPVDEIRAEWTRPDPYGLVRYRDGRRHRPHLEPVSAPYVPLRCDPDGVYLVTGGTRGTGALVARHLVDHGARAVALVGVRPTTDTARALTDRGVRVLQHSGGFPGIGRFLDRVRAELGPLRGVVHCAGTGGQGSPAFVHKATADIRAVLAPKLDGYEDLARLCADDRLDFFCVFSSVCATVPALAAGVSDYATANAAVDELVRAEIAAGRTGMRAVDWPQWAQTGSTSGLPNPCAPAGIAPLDDAAGLRVLDRVLALPVGEVVLPVPPLGPGPDPDALLRVRPDRPAGPTWLAGLVAEVIGVPERDLDPTVEFGDLGVDSVLLGELLVAVEGRLGRPLDPATLLLHPTLEQLTDHLAITTPPTTIPQPPTPAVEDVSPSPAPGGRADPVPGDRSGETVDRRIAIVGMAVRVPGASDPATFWANLLRGDCAVTEVPPGRWDHRVWYSPEPSLGRSISKWGGFVPGVEDFDPGYFDMTDDEARCLDPAIRMFLEGTAECFAEAGYDQAELRGRRVAVVAGARLSDYGRRVPVRSDVLRSDQNFIVARVAHHFDLRGPNLVVDSACSSSLVAVQTACRSLLAGESELAVAGAVEVLLDEHTYLDLSAARALSPTGRCRTFDADADGFVPGEGCVVVLLKPLAAALADGDRVHAVIEAVAVNNDGHTMGVTTPNPAAQADVVRQALAMAGRTPAEVGMVEAHGTGTMIGDPIELRALTEVFAGQPVGGIEVGSVKSNLGHLLSAAGMAGLVKAALAVEHGQIPPTLFCRVPNPRFDVGRSPLHVTTATAPWPPGRDRVAGVSSFGLGGTNAHLVLSAAPPTTPRRTPLPPPVFRRRRLWLDGRAEPDSQRPEPLVASLLHMQVATRD